MTIYSELDSGWSEIFWIPAYAGMTVGKCETYYL